MQSINSNPKKVAPNCNNANFQYGEEDKRTKDCQAFLSKLTQKAVELQKWLQNKEKTVPNMLVNEALPDTTISEMLATVNGIPATPSKIKSNVVSCYSF